MILIKNKFFYIGKEPTTILRSGTPIFTVKNGQSFTIGFDEEQQAFVSVAGKWKLITAANLKTLVKNTAKGEGKPTETRKPSVDGQALEKFREGDKVKINEAAKDKLKSILAVQLHKVTKGRPDHSDHLVAAHTSNTSVYATTNILLDKKMGEIAIRMGLQWQPGAIASLSLKIMLPSSYDNAKNVLRSQTVKDLMQALLNTRRSIQKFGPVAFERLPKFSSGYVSADHVGGNYYTMYYRMLAAGTLQAKGAELPAWAIK